MFALLNLLFAYFWKSKVKKQILGDWNWDGNKIKWIFLYFFLFLYKFTIRKTNLIKETHVNNLP